METIKGIATRLFNQDAETGNVFAWISYETPQGFVDAKMRANAPELKEGDYFVAEGIWRKNTYRGREEEIFSARYLRPHIPDSARGARLWFLSLFDNSKHGVTPASVDAFISKLGPDVATICERDPEKIIGASKDPARYRDAILTTWGRRISGRRAVRMLEDAGVDRHAIDSVLDAFRDSAFDVLRADPYEAARIPKFGFPNADRVGTNIGIPGTDDRRVRAAILESATTARQDGHTFRTMQEIGEDLSSRFAIDMPTIVDFVKRNRHEKSLPFVLDSREDRVVVMPRDLFTSEAVIARKAVSMLADGRRNNPVRIEKVLKPLFASDKFKVFDPIQRRAVAMALEQPFSILTGGPGTGKSTVTEAIAAAAGAIEGDNILLCAPTGKAAKRLEEASGRPATTLHRLLEAKEDKRTGGSDFGRNANKPLPSGAFVIVDESSMIDATTMRALMEAMPADGRLLLVGDRNQLPSVDAGAVLSDLMEARDASGKRIVPRTELINVYRQSRDSRIATGAAQIREGDLPPMSNKFDQGIILYEHEGSAIVQRVKQVVKDILMGRLRFQAHHFSVLVPQAPGPAGAWEINRELSRLLNPMGRNIPGVNRAPSDPADMPIPRVGDRVMLTENDDQADVMNGDVGTITATFNKKGNGGEKPWIRIEFDCGKTVEYPAALWRKLILAYAITIHKSQGSQYNAVIMPVTSAHANMLDRKLFYTGWTRAKSMLFLVGEREAIQAAVDNIETSKRDTRLGEFLTRAAAEKGYRPDWSDSAAVLADSTTPDAQPPKPVTVRFSAPRRPSRTTADERSLAPSLK